MEKKVKQSYENLHMPDADKKRIYNAIVSGEKKEKNNVFPFHQLTKVAVFVLCLLVGTGTVYAASRLLGVKEIVSELGGEKLAGKFDNLSTNVIVKENDEYRATYLGEVSGKKLCETDLNAEEEKTYFVMAIEKKGDEKISYDDKIVVSPFVKGTPPWVFNIYTLGGASASQIVDNVLYCLYECDNLEIFADKGVYLGVMGGAPSAEKYQFHEDSGEISQNAKYEGLNLLFELDIDPAKANPKKAKKYLEEAETAEAEDSDSEDDAFERRIKLKTSMNTREEWSKWVLDNGEVIPESVKTVKPDENGNFFYSWSDGENGGELTIDKEKYKQYREIYKIGKPEPKGSYSIDGNEVKEYVIKLNKDGSITFAVYRYRV